MLRKPYVFLCLVVFLFVAIPVAAQKSCFSSEARAAAEQNAKVYQAPDPDYDPVLGYNPKIGPRHGSPPVDANGFAKPINCVALKKTKQGTGTTPKFYCAVPGVVDENGDPIRYKIKPHFKGQSPDKRNGEVYGEFLSSRFSKAMGFFADDEWVADVTCPDCEKSLIKPFQGAPFSPFQPAAGIELHLEGKGIDENCNGKDWAALGPTLSKLKNGSPRAEVDAFKLWLAFIDHGDTKAQNQKLLCLKSKKNAGGSRDCEPGQAVFYVSDMGSTFGYSSASEKKARLALWKGKDPIKVSGGHCTTTAKSVGDSSISEEGRQLLADNLRKLLDAEHSNGTITKVYRASRNQERDAPPEEWTAEFERKARTIIDARCSQ